LTTAAVVIGSVIGNDRGCSSILLTKAAFKLGRNRYLPESRLFEKYRL